MTTGADVWEKYDSVNGPAFTISPTMIFAGIAIVALVFVIIRLVKNKSRKKLTPEDRLLTADIIDEMPIDDFIDITDEQYQQANDVGCYIIYNTDKEKYYVGKSPLCADAVNRQIIGKGSPDIFFEKKNGDEFTIQFYFVGEGSVYADAESLYEDIVEVYGENSEVVRV